MGSSGAITAPVSPVNLTTVAAGTMLANKLAGGDANPAFAVLGDGTLEWGVGGASAPDTTISRVGAANGGALRVLVNGVRTFQTDFSGTSYVQLLQGLSAGGGVLNSFFNLQTDGTIGVRLADLAIQDVGRGLKVKEGANARMGVATLAAGTVTVANTTITATTRIFLTNDTPGGAPGFLRVSATVVGTSFTITSSSGTDTSTVAWLLLEPG